MIGAVLRTARLLMAPVAFADLPDLVALKGSPLVFAQMLGGVRDAIRTQQELAEDVVFWGRRRIGIWAVRAAADHKFLGIAGIMDRPDGRGLALRFATWPHIRGHGLAREAAAAALRHAHDHAGIARLIAVAREDNIASRGVLGGIGMRITGTFLRYGDLMMVYESNANGLSSSPLPSD